MTSEIGIKNIISSVCNEPDTLTCESVIFNTFLPERCKLIKVTLDS